MTSWRSRGLPWAACCLLLCLAPLIPVSADAGAFPPPDFDRFGRQQGLPNLSVSSLVRDSHGYLWIGTQGGVCVWDGLDFQVFRHDPAREDSLSHNLVQTLWIDSDDVLWIGTYGGLNRFDPQSGIMTRFVHNPEKPDSISNDIVTSIYRDRQGILWAGTLDGLNRMDETRGTFRRYRALGRPGDLGHRTVRTIQEDAGGALWVGTSGGGLGQYLPDRDAFATLRHDADRADSLPSDSVMDLLLDRRGRLWAACWGGGLARMDNPAGRFTTISLKDNRIYCILEDGPSIWAGSWGGGLFRLDTATGTSAGWNNRDGDPTSLSNDTVYSLLKDPGGILWVGTNGGGLNRYNSRHARFRSRNPMAEAGLGGNRKVTALLEDRKGRLWAGTYNGGLLMQSPGTQTWNHYSHEATDPGSLSGDLVTRIFEDSAGNVWVLTTDGLNRWDEATGRFTAYLPGKAPVPEIPDSIVYDMVQDPSGVFWLATYTRGVVKFDPSSGKVQIWSYDPASGTGIADNMVYTLYLDRKGGLWAGTNRGLSRIDTADGSVRNWAHDPARADSLATNTVRQVLEDSQGRIWVATNGGGLDQYDPARDAFLHHDTRNGFPHMTINSLMEGPGCVLWMGTTSGLCAFDPGNGFMVTYTDEDGLQDLEFSQAAARTSTGAMLFGGPGGISLVNDFDTRNMGPIPQVDITSVMIANQKRNSGFPASTMHDLVLAAGERQISFTLAVLDYARPEHNQYAWKLEGFDTDWVYSNRNYATYTNLAPGTYTFRIRGANARGIWNDEGKSLNIQVEYPWYLSPPAMTGWLALAGGLIFLAMRVRTNYALRHKIRELQELRRELEEANAKLEFLSTHDPLTGLPNRRALDQRLEENWVFCQRQDLPMGVIMLDVDHFKKYNDTHGHLSGDIVLRAVAMTMDAAMQRNTDMAGRFGGEEFMVLLPGSSPEGTLQVAERLRAAVEALRIPRDAPIAPEFLAGLSLSGKAQEPAETCGESDSHVTISAGVASLVPHGRISADALVRQADDALYRAKENGRNRTMA